MKLTLLSIPILLLILIVINISSFTLNMYLYVFITFFIIVNIFTKQNIKGWFWLSFFLIFYSFPHFITYYLFGENNIIANGTLHSIMNNRDYNLEAIRLVSSFVVCLFLGSIIYIVFIKHKSVINHNKNKYVNKFYTMTLGKKFFFFLLITFLLLGSFLTIDFSALQNTYELTSGFTLLFSACYILNFFIVFYYFNENFKKKYLYIFVLLYSVLLGYLGVRQVIFWLILSLLISYFLKTHIQNKKVKWIPIIVYSVLFFIFMASVLGYRTTKEFHLDILTSLGTIGFYAILAETSFTFYNMLASIDLSSSTDFFFMKDFLDTLYLLIPSQIFPNKNELITLIQFSKDYNIAPFGTYYLLGELKLSLRYDLFILVFALIIGFISEYFLEYTLKNPNRLLLVLYSSFLVMLIVYPVRGTIPSGAKIFISFYLLPYFILKYKISYRKST